MSWKGTIEGNIPVTGLTQWREDATLSYKQTLEGLNAIINARSTGSLKSRQIEPTGILEMTKNPSFMDTLINIGGKSFAMTIETVSGALLAPDLWDLSLGFGKVKETAFSYESVDVELHDRWKYLIMEDFDTDAEWDASLPSTFSSLGYGRQVQDIPWEIASGSWGVNSTVNGLIGPSVPPTALECTTTGSIIAGWDFWDNYEFSVRYRTDLSSDLVGIYFRYVDSDNYYRWYWSTTTNLKLLKVVGGSSSDIGDSTYTITEDIWNQMKIVCQGGRLRGYVNDVEIFDLIDDSLSSGGVGVYASATNVYFDDMKVTLLPPENLNTPACVDQIDQYTHKSINTAYGTQKRLIAPEDNINFEVTQGEDCVYNLTFEEGEGTTIYDYSKNGNDSVVVSGSPTWVEDLQKGWVLSFDSVDDIIESDITGTLTGEDHVTIDFDMYLPAGLTSGFEFLLGISKLNTDNIYFYLDDGDLIVRDNINGANDAAYTVAYTPDKWIRYTLIVTDSTFLGFMDGELKFIWENAAGNTFSDIDPDYVTIGCHNEDHVVFGRLLIKNFRIFSKVREDVVLGIDKTPATVFAFDEYASSSDSDCVLLLHMDEGYGTTTYDASGKGHDGSFVLTPAWATTSFRGEAGTCVEFDGTTEHSINVAHHSDFNFGDGSSDSPFTIEAWIYVDNLASLRMILSKWDNAAEREYEFFVFTDGSLRLHLYDDSAGANIYCLSAAGAIVTDQRYHVVGTYDGNPSGGKESGITLYINGVDVSLTRAEVGTYTAMEPLTQAVEIGIRDGTEYNWDGKIDEVRIHRAELTAEEIASRFRSEPYLHDWVLMDRVYHKSHNWRGLPVITNGLIMLAFPDYNIYEGRTADVLLPAIYGWYENSWHLLGYISPYVQVNGQAKHVVDSADNSEWAIEELTDQYCKMRISYRVVDSAWPDENVVTFYLTVKNGYPGVIVEMDPDDYQINDRHGFVLSNHLSLGMGVANQFWFAPESTTKDASSDSDFELTTSQIDDNWCVLYGDKNDSNAPSKNVIIGIFTDSLYDDLGSGTQWSVVKAASSWGLVRAYQTKNGGIFFVPYDVDDLPTVPFSNGVDYPADLAHQPFKNTIPQRAWRIRKDTAYQLG